jgi:hypothetical protein
MKKLRKLLNILWFPEFIKLALHKKMSFFWHSETQKTFKVSNDSEKPKHIATFQKNIKI